MQDSDPVVADFEAECPSCGHTHFGMWEEGLTESDAGKQFMWCDAVVCGDGCCNCPCYFERVAGASTATVPQ